MKGRTVQQHYALAAASRGQLFQLTKDIVVGSLQGAFHTPHSFGPAVVKSCLKAGWLSREPTPYVLRRGLAHRYALTQAGEAELARPLLRAAARRKAGMPAQEARP